MKKRQWYISFLLVLLALVSMSAASVAWFTIANYTKLYSMGLEITSGTNLRFDLDAHGTFDEYIKTLSFEQIAQRVEEELGYDMRTVPLEPVTTSDCEVFTYEDGSVVPVDSGAYLEFVLHFMATDDMVVHLTSANRAQNADGTRVSSSNERLPESMRISFTAEGKTYVYHPGKGDFCEEGDALKHFGLPDASQMVLNDNNQMFIARKDEDQTVVVRIWLEGTDPACDDELRNADYRIQLRFEGTDEYNNPLDGERDEFK